uniref:Uncharacterized protein n=1 Tax=Meloidogyne enterolobii TaxID=390850 RepID=A0A6V7W3F4_MELEN|nr:unnamed protein product [Meloidogyne enterolobii]
MDEIRDKIDFYKKINLENYWQEINLKMRKLDLLGEINKYDEYENLIKEIRECYENIEKGGYI